MIRTILLSVFTLLFSVLHVQAQPKTLLDSAKVIIENNELEVYHGWIKYLLFDVEVVIKRPDINSEEAAKRYQRLRWWINKINENQDIIKELRGSHEWAYESDADGSGQPFMITIPLDYNADSAMPLSLYMHGYSGNHSEHFYRNDSLKGMFESGVLGRSRGGRYVGLSGADVTDVLDYIEANWNIDPDRIHILGGSMGGQGTFRMGCLYPYRFASARPTCGFGSDKPFGNLITLPFYVTHSDDDMVVPILHSQGPVERLQESGGQVVYDWTTGLGHASWDYTEGNTRSDEWFKKQSRPDTKEIKHINYTAFDCEAMRSWWAGIEEWGDQPKPAQFILTAGENNILYAKLTNINQLKLQINESPFDVIYPLQISINGAPFIVRENPLPDEIWLRNTENGWQIVDTTDTPPVRRHTPGGPNLLYNGDPLLIVYGTQGSKKINSAMLSAARIAGKSSDAMWQKPNGEQAPDKIHHNQLLYGDLNIKADTAVTEEDIKRCHLVLIGTAEQNNIVAGLEKDLPVSFTKKEIEFSDGETYDAKGMGIGLVYYNPRAPKNLIFWVASNDVDLYKEDSPVPRLMTFQFGFFYAPAPGHDCVISAADQLTLVAARSFNSKWEWLSRNEKEEIISGSIKTNADYILELNKAIKSETAADFVFTCLPERVDYNPKEIPFAEGITRLGDLVNSYFYEPIGIAEITGEELLNMLDSLDKAGQSFYPEPEDVDTGKIYRLAVSEISIWELVKLSKYAPRNYKLTDIQLSTAVKRFFPVE